MSERSTEVLTLSASIKPMLAGHDPDIQGGALVDLVSMFVAGHHPDVRAKVLTVLVDTIRDMIPTQAEAMFGPKGWPR